MATEMLPLLREEDKIRCTACGNCIRACGGGVLEIHNQRVTIGELECTMPVILVAHPEKCYHDGRCLVACPQKVYPCLYPQNVEDVKRRAEEILAREPDP
jgi:NAD-dependent dihydropyrimidine dehydrogenase PreA subunit